MSIESSLFSGLKIVQSLLEKVLSKRGTKIEKKILAVSTMRKAINATEIYLVTSNYNYKPNQELSELWNIAFTAMIPIDKNIAIKLNSKSRFWSNPQKWLNEASAMELIPELKELDELCEMQLNVLKRRL